MTDSTGEGINAEMLAALRLHKAWADSEASGPDYGGQTRDTHPDGERIWRAWWDNQLDLCARANAATDAAIARAQSSPPLDRDSIRREIVGEVLNLIDGYRRMSHDTPEVREIEAGIRGAFPSLAQPKEAGDTPAEQKEP